MPTYETTEPIAATIDVGLGDVRLTAAERADTVVDVEPTDAANDQDRRAAELTRVEYANGRLLVKAPKLRSWRRGGGSIRVTIDLPAGSNVRGMGGATDFRCEGPLGECTIKTGVGRIELDRAQVLTVKSGTGDVSVGRVTGHAVFAIASGDVRVGELDSTGVFKRSSGDTWVGAAGGDLRVITASGDIAVDVSRASVVAKAAKGDIRLGEAVRGSLALETRVGDVQVGIPEGTAAWLDVRSTAGTVRSDLDAADGPTVAADTLEVRGRTTVGDVVITRAARSAVSA